MIGRRFLLNIVHMNKICSRLQIQNLSSQFESSISLKNIYPLSSLDICKPYTIPSNSDETFSGYIPIDQVSISYCKSSGPGGQHVNKVNTKVDLRFHLQTANWIPDTIKKNLEQKFQTRINKMGFFIIKSERTRSQQLNVADALDKLRFMIQSATYIIPPPNYKDIEIQRRRIEKSSRQRLRVKREKSIIKNNRQGPE